MKPTTIVGFNFECNIMVVVNSHTGPSFVGPAMDELANVPYKDSFITIGGSEWVNDFLHDSSNTLQLFNNTAFKWESTSKEKLLEKKGLVAAFPVDKDAFPKCQVTSAINVTTCTCATLSCVLECVNVNIRQPVMPEGFR